MGSGRGKTQIVKSRQNLFASSMSPDRTGEVFYARIRYPWYSSSPKDVEVIQNPTDRQKRQLLDEAKKEKNDELNEKIGIENRKYDFNLYKDSDFIRTTYDIDGNTYIWKSSESIHAPIEEFIEKKYTTLLAQDRDFVKFNGEWAVEKHWTEVNWEEFTYNEKNLKEHPMTFETLREYNRDKQYEYTVSLAYNRILNQRGEVIQKEVESVPRDYELLSKRMRESSIDIGIELGTYRSYSTQHGDIKLQENPEAGLSEKQWKQVFKAFGGIEGDTRTGYNAYSLLNMYISQKFRNPDRMSDPAGDLVFYKFEGVGGVINPRIIQKAMMNISLLKSPYDGNDGAGGAIKWDEDNSPTTDHNLQIAGRINYAVKAMNELNAVYKERFPSLRPVSGMSFVPQTEKDNSSTIAYYHPGNLRIRVLPRALNPEFDHLNVDVGNFIVAGISNFPLLDSLSHEFGHAIHYQLTREKYRQDGVLSAIKKHNNLFDFDPRDDYTAQQDIEGGLFAVSPYGNLNKLEAFAEAFSLYTTGAEPTMGKEYYSHFKTLMKDLGLEKFHAIYQKVSAPDGGILNSTAKTVQKTTLPTAKSDATPQTDKFTFSLEGKSFTKTLPKSAVERGYFTKRLSGYEYTIDSQSGVVLKKSPVKGK